MNKNTIDRRKFIAALSLGTAHLLFTHPLLAAGTNIFSIDPLQKITLGETGLQTTLLGLGTGVNAINRSSFMTRQQRDKSVALIRYAYDKGIRYFDCADSYGTHGLVAEAKQKMDRDKLFITSKMWVRGGGIPDADKADANVEVDRFRKELKTDYIDLIQLHCMVDPDWTDTQKKQMDILDNLKAKGIIKAHGVSVHTLEAMKAALKSPWVDIIHVRINPYGIAMDKPDPKEVVEVIQQLHKAGKGVIGMKLVGNGQFRDDSKKIDNSLRFVLGLGCVNMLIVGFEEPAEIDNYLSRMKTTLGEMDRG